MKLVIVDRDGVINEDSDEFIKSPGEFIPLQGSMEAIARLNQAGYKVAVVTNQSGISRGYLDLDTLNDIHEKLHLLLSRVHGKVDGIYYCPHGPDDGCDCRKPKAGLYHQIARDFNLSLEEVPAIGDSLRDLEAARMVSAKPILVLTGKGQKTLESNVGLEGVPVYENLAEAVDALLKVDS